MSRQLLPLYYEGDIPAWFRERFPTVEIYKIIVVDENTYHILMSEANATNIEAHLHKNFEPPFTRRALTTTEDEQPEYEPGIVFQYYGYQQPIATLKRTETAYKSAIPNVSDTIDRDFIQNKLDELSVRISEKERRQAQPAVDM